MFQTFLYKCTTYSSIDVSKVAFIFKLVWHAFSLIKKQIKPPQEAEILLYYRTDIIAQIPIMANKERKLLTNIKPDIKEEVPVSATQNFGVNVLKKTVTVNLKKQSSFVNHCICICDTDFGCSCQLLWCYMGFLNIGLVVPGKRTCTSFEVCQNQHNTLN